MPTPPSAKPLGFGTCCTELPSKGGERCGARILWKLDKNGLAFYRCRGEYDGRSCGAPHGPLSRYETDHLKKQFEKINGQPAEPAGEQPKGTPEPEPKPEPQREPEPVAGDAGEPEPEPERERERSGYVFDQ